MQWQLERSQWWPPEALLEHQFRQLHELAGHAVANVPYYRLALEKAGVSRVEELDPQSFRRWPILRKSELRENETALRARRYPSAHGALSTASTTGSTGEPVRVIYTEVAQYFSAALSLRDHLLHERDLSGKMAMIKSAEPRVTASSWGRLDAAFDTGPLCTFDSSADIDAQLAWLREERPKYLLTQASNLRALVLQSRARGTPLRGLAQAITTNDAPAPDLRQLLRETWSASLAATYIAEECGPIASQCPGHDHYLVHAENLYLEVLRDDGSPCAPGETGRVVLTTLHNFAMPLIRYDIGDYAERGGECLTGRGLPVLARVVGRVRNMARDPDGRRFFPSFPAEIWLDVAPLQKIQLRQTALDSIEVRYEMKRALTRAEEAQLTVSLHGRLQYPFRISFARFDRIPRVGGDKFEDFVSEIPAG